MNRAIIIIIVSLIFSYSLIASQVHLQPYEKNAKNITNVCILKVDKIESEEKYRHFKNGKKRLISTTIIIYGTVVENMFGKVKDKVIITKFTTVIPVRYSDDAEVVVTKSIQKCISGYEHLPKMGESYIFSYTWFDNQKIHYHSRMDLIKEKFKITEILKKNKKI